MKDSLLDYLADEMHCLYVSDLSCTKLDKTHLQSALDKAKSQQFQHAEWIDACEYITRQSVDSGTAAQTTLTEFCKRRR